MKMKYDISIIVPCYNCEKFVEETILSLLRQNYDFSKIELILINDGSTDHTIDVLNSYQRENIIVIDKKNEGVSKTRNLGLKKATGKYILFLDGDDFLSKNSIKNIISFFNKHYDEIDLLTYPLIMYYNKRNKRVHFRYQKEYTKGTGIYPLDQYYRIVQTGINIVIKNDKKYQFDYHKKYGEDEYFDTAILMEKKKIGYVKDAKYYYRQHAGSITHKKNVQDFEAHYSFYDEELKKYNNHIYIQYLVINNLRWRIQENHLYPDNISNVDDYIKGITDRLQAIDLSLFQNDIQENVLLNLIGLQNKKYEVRENEVWIKNTKIGEFHNYNKISRIEVMENKIKLYGTLETPNLKNNPQFFINGVKVPLYYKASYQKNILRYYECEIDISDTLEFCLKDKKKEYELVTIPVDWVSHIKVMDKYNIKIKNKIKISKKKIFSTIINKYRNIRSLKFLCINILSSFYVSDRKKTLYYTSKDSKVYELYQNDKNKKIWLDKNKGLRYKMLLLNCNKLVTDQDIQVVIPFGTLRKNYVQSSRFAVKVYGDKFEERSYKDYFTEN